MNPADLTLTISPSLTNKTLAIATVAHKNGKLPVARVDLEPIYTQLKGALGDGWNDYKAAVSAFVLGKSHLRSKTMNG
jgi:transcriptional coactivator HFI1/ADA1